MADLPCVSALAPTDPAAADSATTDASARVRAVVEAHYDLAWRTLRTLGLDDATADDGAQQVMCVVARRIEEIAPGVERSFVLSTTWRVAATLRRTAKGRPESTDEDIDGLVAATPSSEELLDQRRAREVLQGVLDAMPIELRVVFVLFEIEELTTREIARIIAIPHGTTPGSRAGRRRVRCATCRRIVPRGLSPEPLRGTRPLGRRVESVIVRRVAGHSSLRRRSS
jgi:RNA polymerase sigma-70 factor (ECF subfamily)